MSKNSAQISPEKCVNFSVIPHASGYSRQTLLFSTGELRLILDQIDWYACINGQQLLKNAERLLLYEKWRRPGPGVATGVAGALIVPESPVAEGLHFLKESWEEFRSLTRIPKGMHKPLEGWVETLGFVFEIGKTAAVEWRKVPVNG
jgi:hypothetical protein